MYGFIAVCVSENFIAICVANNGSEKREGDKEQKQINKWQRHENSVSITKRIDCCELHRMQILYKCTVVLLIASTNRVVCVCLIYPNYGTSPLAPNVWEKFRYPLTNGSSSE